MRIVEFFSSKQGEGLWTGVDSAFVRVVGCPLHCRFCDTPYAFWESGEGEELCVEEIVGRVLLYGQRHVILTGGEPMLYAETIPLTELLKAQGFAITIETSGTLDLAVVCDLMSISPKLSNSTPDQSVDSAIVRRHESNRSRPEIVKALTRRYNYQLKFVVDTQEDLDEISDYLRQFDHLQTNRILLMPQGTDPETLEEKEQWIRPFCKKHGFQFAQRMHVFWFGNKRGT